MHIPKLDNLVIPTSWLLFFLKSLMVVGITAGVGGCGGGGSGGTNGETSPPNQNLQTIESVQFSPMPDMGAAAVQGNVSEVATVQTDLRRAYGDAAAKKATVLLNLADIGGQTLAPGIYQFDGSLDIAAGDLTLDAHGDVQAVWIFQVADMLRIAAGRQILLRGGAEASNIYWQVSGSVWVGEGAALTGIVLADNSIALKNGAKVEGQFFSLNGTVYLSSNTVSDFQAVTW